MFIRYRQFVPRKTYQIFSLLPFEYFQFSWSYFTSLLDRASELCDCEMNSNVKKASSIPFLTWVIRLDLSQYTTHTSISCMSVYAMRSLTSHFFVAIILNYNDLFNTTQADFRHLLSPASFAATANVMTLFICITFTYGHNCPFVYITKQPIDSCTKFSFWTLIFHWAEREKNTKFFYEYECQKKYVWKPVKICKI